MEKFCIMFLIFCFIFSSCALLEVEKSSCPSEDVYFMVYTPHGQIPTMMPKGFLDDSENFKTREQYNKWMDKKMEQFRKMMEEKDKQI